MAQQLGVPLGPAGTAASLHRLRLASGLRQGGRRQLPTRHPCGGCWGRRLRGDLAPWQQGQSATQVPSRVAAFRFNHHGFLPLPTNLGVSHENPNALWLWGSEKELTSGMETPYIRSGGRAPRRTLQSIRTWSLDQFGATACAGIAPDCCNPVAGGS